MNQRALSTSRTVWALVVILLAGRTVAVEAEIPESVREKMAEAKRTFHNVRYEIEVGLDSSDEIGIERETLWLRDSSAPRQPQKRLEFPSPLELSPSLLAAKASHLEAAIKKTF